VRIGVIGTGVAGSLFITAAKMAAAADDLVAFDRIALGERDEAGTGLNIGPNALKALRLKGGLCLEELRSKSLPWRRWQIALTSGTKLLDLDLLDVADEPGLRIRWADLYSVLRSGSADRTRYGRAFEALEEDSAGRLIPVFRDPSGTLTREGAFDLLVAADGRYSKLRETILGTPKSYFPGIGTWRLLVHDVRECPIDDYGQYFCGNARLLSFRLPDNCVYIAGSFPLAGAGPMAEEVKTAFAQRRFFVPPDGKISPEVSWMLSMLDAHIATASWARTQDIETAHQAMDGRVLLLGDAAHAMFQTLGQGATQAIEDALAAAAILGSKPVSPQIFCSAYEILRENRVAFAKQFNRDATDTLMPDVDVVAGSLAKGQEPFLSRLRTLYRNVE
jgi:2-polyprenyl-6-methoxyphenol hydroxylase-like FAD-dependent oxidoreductase